MVLSKHLYTEFIQSWELLSLYKAIQIKTSLTKQIKVADVSTELDGYTQKFKL